MSNEDKQRAKIKDVTLECVWEKVTPELAREAMAFWVAENALQGGEKEMEIRARQLLVIARDADNRLIAVSTAERMRIPALMNNIFYYYRCFVSSHHRSQGLAMAISHKAREYLHPRFLRGEDTVAKGFYLAIENDVLKKVHTQAVLVVGGMDHAFIGVDEKGRHLRVGWFDGANID